MDKRIFYVGTTIVGIGLIYLILKKNIAKNMKSSKPLKSILFVGDSITAITYQGKPVTYTYPNVIKKEVEQKGVKVDDWAIRVKRTRVKNVSVKLKQINSEIKFLKFN